ARSLRPLVLAGEHRPQQARSERAAACAVGRGLLAGLLLLRPHARADRARCAACRTRAGQSPARRTLAGEVDSPPPRRARDRERTPLPVLRVRLARRTGLP